jgi:hypothetical protein
VPPGPFPLSLRVLLHPALQSTPFLPPVHPSFYLVSLVLQSRSLLPLRLLPTLHCRLRSFIVTWFLAFTRSTPRVSIHCGGDVCELTGLGAGAGLALVCWLFRAGCGWRMNGPGRRLATKCCQWCGAAPGPFRAAGELDSGPSACRGGTRGRGGPWPWGPSPASTLGYPGVVIVDGLDWMGWGKGVDLEWKWRPLTNVNLRFLNAIICCSVCQLQLFRRSL